jgi:hypothetical protein
MKGIGLRNIDSIEATCLLVTGLERALVCQCVKSHSLSPFAVFSGDDGLLEKGLGNGSANEVRWVFVCPIVLLRDGAENSGSVWLMNFVI